MATDETEGVEEPPASERDEPESRSTPAPEDLPPGAPEPSTAEPAPKKKRKRPRCVDHPDARARDTCRRCGDFRCEACFGGERSDVCLTCAPLRLPWKAGASFTSFADSLAMIFGTRGPGVFRDDVGTWAWEGGPAFARAVGLLSGLVGAPVAVMAMDGSAAGPSLDGPALLGAILGIAIGIAFAMVMSQVAGAVSGWVYHQAARLLGGTGDRGSSLNAGYFATALSVPSSAVRLAAAVIPVPWVGAVLSLLGAAGISLWWIVLVRQHAMRVHELSETRASLAAGAPFLVGAALGFVIVAVLVASGSDLSWLSATR